eukprot:11575537-Prorocentrum_lima.AAC.1
MESRLATAARAPRTAAPLMGPPSGPAPTTRDLFSVDDPMPEADCMHGPHCGVGRVAITEFA